jgi:pimeloyl-ACP methyl ester carboxylesterase
MDSHTNTPGRPASPPLPPALPGERHVLDGALGRVVFYAAGPAGGASAEPPLLLIHSINAAASAAEVRPLHEHYRSHRAVYAVDLPGYGLSDRSVRPYTPRLMTDAILAVAAEVQRLHQQPLDAVAVSLSCEYLARAAQESPGLFRSVALVSPTGFNCRRPLEGPSGSTRGKRWLLRLLSSPLWGGALFGLLTRPSVIRYFLQRTWGAKQIDEGLFAYCCLTTRQPGAENAPFYFLSGFLFSADISRVYQSLPIPVWMAHGVRGDFVDYRYRRAIEQKPNWTVEVFQTGALPYFEQLEPFVCSHQAFLDGVAAR